LNLARRWGLLSGVVIRSFLVVTIALVAAASGDRGVALAGPAAVVERGGVVLRLELDRGAIAPGELLWATLTVSNTNDHDLKWTAGGCRILGLVEALPLLPDAGRHWPGALGTFKAWALKYPESYAYFADETSWAHRGGACPAAQFMEILPAGATRRSRWVWNGYISNAASGSRAAPGGQMEIVGSFFLGEPQSTTQLRVVAPVRIIGGPDPYITAGVALDRAFDDGRLTRWLEGRPLPAVSGAGGIGDIVGGVKLEGGTWRVLAAQKVLVPDYRLSEIEVRVDARDGKVVSVVER